MRDLTIRRAIALAVFALLCAATDAAAQDSPSCDTVVGRIDAAVPADQIAVRLTRACAPYAEVRVSYGPFVFDEELSVNGTLDVMLPAIADAREVAFNWPDGQARLAVRSEQANDGVAAIEWPDGTAWGRLTGTQGGAAHRLGFPRPGARGVDVMILGAGEVPVLTAPVTPQTCGQEMRATVLSGPDLVWQPLSLVMPACDAAGRTTLRLTLPR